MAKAFGEFVTDPATALIHGDLNFNNVMWANGVTALLDFEWSRPEARDVDLMNVLSFCQYAKRCVPESVEAVTSSEDYLRVPDWLRASYPSCLRILTSVNESPSTTCRVGRRGSIDQLPKLVSLRTTCWRTLFRATEPPTTSIGECRRDACVSDRALRCCNVGML